MAALIVLHGLVALGAPAVGARWGRRVFWWCALAPATTVAWAAWHAPDIGDGHPVTETVGWVPELGLTISLRLDAFSLLMVALVSGIGVLVFLYAASYFAGRETPKLGVFAAQLTAFSGAMLGLVLADNVFVLFVFWELTSITSYLLIGYDDEKGSARAAARQALLITAGGGLALLGGLVLLSQAAGTASLHELLADPPSGGVVSVALVLVVLGAATKSAQVPFHSWLPGAMVAPTPVSAYLHSATMVKAGVYLIARFAPAFAVEGIWRPLVVTIGVVTMLVGGYRALRQHDLKLLLAFGTVSQLGFLVVLFGTGEPAATKAGAALLLAHGLFKAALFLTVGVIDHQAHTRDVRVLSGLGRRLPVLCGTAVLAAASMAGIPPLLGFIAKEQAYEAYVHGGLGRIGDALVLAGIVAGSVLTVAYSARFVRGAFASKKSPPTGADLVGADVARPARSFVAPIGLLAGIGLVLGLVPSLTDALVRDGAAVLDAMVHPGGLELWHGISTALGLSAVTILLGTVLVVARRRVERFQAKAPSPAGSDAAYRGSLEWLNRGADRLTGIVQNGSLPTYLTVIALTVLALPGIALIAGAVWPDDLVFADSSLQAIVVGLLVVAAFAATMVHRRFVAVLLVGAVGYAMAALFVIQGGPDLALTQLLIETLTVVVFVLVLRHLPERFPVPRWRVMGVTRAVVAVAVGVFMAAFTMVAVGVRTEPRVSGGLVERSLPEGGGRNVVNVILTDFRALDTLGEISVLAVSALGITSLILAGRRRARAEPEESR
jgi:multicomponent Na+:H+ antiporter subunit A